MKVIIPIVGNDSLENNTDYMLSLYEIERKTIFQYCYDFLKPIKNAEFKVQEDNDGLIMTMYANDDKWSFIAFDDQKLVTMVREKEVISNEATVGIYNFKYGKDFVSYAHKMIDLDLRVKGEFYVAPIYNMLIDDGKKIVFHNIGSVGAGMYGLGVPEDLDAFLAHPISEKF